MHKDSPQIFIKLAAWLRSKWRIDDSFELTGQLAHIFIYLERATCDWKMPEVALDSKTCCSDAELRGRHEEITPNQDFNC